MVLHHRILIGMALGLVIGLGLFFWGDPSTPAFTTAIWILDLFGKDVFIGALKMIIAPLIFASIVSGVTSLPSARETGAVGARILAYYLSTTCIAVALGILCVQLVQPGKREASQRVRAARVETLDEYRASFARERGVDPRQAEHQAAFREYIAQREGEGLSASEFRAQWETMQMAQARGPAEMFRQALLRPILSNPFNALAESPPNSLGIIFFALITGLACLAAGESAGPVVRFFSGFNDVMMRITGWIMELAPVCIGCIIASLVATLGMDALRSLAWYCGVVIGGIAAHVCVLLALVWSVGRVDPLTFLKGIRAAWLIAFTTTSSAATLPVTIRNVTENLNVQPRIARFTLPVGATMNMDGTALYEGVAVIFLIQMYGGLEDVAIELTGMKLFIVFVTAVFASIGAAAVPSAGLITMVIVASAVGLPVYYIYIIYAVDHVLDMFRTSTNVMGDAVGAVIVDRLERHRLSGTPAASGVRI